MEQVLLVSTRGNVLARPIYDHRWGGSRDGVFVPVEALRYRS